MIDINDDIWVLNEDKISQTTENKDSLPKPEEGLCEQVVKEEVPERDKILVLKGDDEDIIVDTSPFIIGKGDMSDHIIRGDTYISRKHCRITKRRGDYYIEDMRSTNGTFIDGEKISSKTELQEGMEVVLADKKYEVTWQS